MVTDNQSNQLDLFLTGILRENAESEFPSNFSEVLFIKILLLYFTKIFILFWACPTLESNFFREIKVKHVDSHIC